MTERNAYQIAEWNGSIGERWLANQARLDAMLAVFGEAAIEVAAPAKGEYVLDIGCGTGTTSFALAARVGAQGQVVGIDISETLVGRARQCMPEGAPVLFELADAGSVALPEGAFDLLFSRFGVMFFDNPTAAFAHIRRALKSDGRVAFVCWRGLQENEWVSLPMGAVRDIILPPTPPDPEAPGPFSFGSPDRVVHILRTAGFSEITIKPFDHAVPLGRGDTREKALDDAVEMAFQVGPLARALADEPDNIRARASAAVRAAFAERPEKRSVMVAGATWIVTARNRTGDPD